MTDAYLGQASLPRSLWRLLRFVFTRVVKEPIAAGRLKDEDWPPGLKGIVVAWAVVYAAMGLAAVLATPIRSHSPLLSDQITTLPAAALPLVTVAFIFAFSCLYTAGLHLVWWLRVSVTVVVVAFLLQGVYWSLPQSSDVALLVAAGLLVVMVVVRWGRRFHWLEFVVALLVIACGVVTQVIVAQQGVLGLATDFRLNALLYLSGFAWCLAVPAGLVAGAAMAELTVSAVAWTVTGVWQELGGRRRRSPAVAVVLIALLVALRSAQVGWHVWHGTPGFEPMSVLPSVAAFAAVLIACALVVWRADRVHSGDPPVRPDPDDVTAAWGWWSLVPAVLLGVALSGGQLVDRVLSAFGLADVGNAIGRAGGDRQFIALAMLAAVIMLVIAFVLGSRGRRVAAVIMAAQGAWWIASTVPSWFNLLATEAGVTVGAALAAFGVFVWLLIRRRLTTVRAVALATVLILSGILEYRDVLEEPLTAAFSLVGISAALLVGLLWRMLTDNGYSRTDSRRFPQPSRVLIALASTTYAVTSIGLVSLVGGYSPHDIELLESSGDISLGLGLACAAFFAGLSLAARGRLVRSDQPRDDYGRLLAPDRTR